MKVWFDPEGDFLEVTFSDEPGYMRATDNDAVMERVSERGKILGFSIMRVSRSRKRSHCWPFFRECPHAGLFRALSSAIPM